MRAEGQEGATSEFIVKEILSKLPNFMLRYKGSYLYMRTISTSVTTPNGLEVYNWVRKAAN